MYCKKRFFLFALIFFFNLRKKMLFTTCCLKLLENESYKTIDQKQKIDINF